MKILSIDTETTSKYPSNARLLSLGVVEFEISGDSISSPKRVQEFFFDVPYEVPADASRVNGLTREKLHKLSGGRSLECSFDLLEEYLYSGYPVIGYNVEKYDIPVLVSNTMNVGWDRPVFGQLIDVYKMVKGSRMSNLRNRQLGTVFQQFLVETGLTEAKLQSQFGLFYKGGGQNVAHNAAWDAFMTYHLFRYIR